MKCSILLFVIYIIISDVVKCFDKLDNSTNKVLNSIAKHVSYIIIECRKEVNFSVRVILEFLRFFDPQYRLQEPELGCVVKCVHLKMNLLDRDGQLQMVTLRQLLKKNGADTKLSDKIARMFKDCHSLVGSDQSFCNQGLTLARCLREKAFQEKWSPNMSAHIEF